MHSLERILPLVDLFKRNFLFSWLVYATLISPPKWTLNKFNSHLQFATEAFVLFVHLRQFLPSRFGISLGKMLIKFLHTATNFYSHGKETSTLGRNSRAVNERSGGVLCGTGHGGEKGGIEGEETKYQDRHLQLEDERSLSGKQESQLGQDDNYCVDAGADAQVRGGDIPITIIQLP